MRRMCEILFVSLLAVCFAGCSGLSDIKSRVAAARPSHRRDGQTRDHYAGPLHDAIIHCRCSGKQQSSRHLAGERRHWRHATTGIISTAGLYTAPQSISSSLVPATNAPITVTVTAISQASATATGTAVVTLTTQQQQTQSGAIKLGTSGGNINDTSSNFLLLRYSGFVRARSGTHYILSNNHVMALSDGGHASTGNAGDAITQPGLIEVKCVAHSTRQVANLSEFFNLQTGPNPKDRCRPSASGQRRSEYQRRHSASRQHAHEWRSRSRPGRCVVHFRGWPYSHSGVASPHNGAVAKSGRTTGLTCSTIIGTNVANTVNYYAHCGDSTPAFNVGYTDLIAVSGGDFSDSGDSGSLIVTQDTAEAVGLLFAGSDTDTVGNPITDVLPYFVGAGNATPTFGTPASNLLTRSSAAPCRRSKQSPFFRRSRPLPNPFSRQAWLGFARSATPDYSGSQSREPLVGATISPAQAAILLFVGSGESFDGIPRTLDGVRTRLSMEMMGPSGLLSSEETADLLSAADQPQIIVSLAAGRIFARQDRSLRPRQGSAEAARNPWRRHHFQC